jgi:hypothetical protein
LRPVRDRIAPAQAVISIPTGFQALGCPSTRAEHDREETNPYTGAGLSGFSVEINPQIGI